MQQGSIVRVWRLALAAALVVTLAACSSSNNNASTPTSDESAASATSSPVTGALVPSSTPGRPGGFGAPGGNLALPTSAAGTAAAAGTPLSQQQLDQMALGPTDLPAGFAVTGSGPGGPELGRDVLTSYQEEFQQRDVTSSQSLQQTIVIIDLLGQYKDASSALGGIRALNVQSLNQLLGSVNLTAEAAPTVPAIGEDSAGYHFSGDTNGTSVGGYLIVFHRGSVATLILTAAVKGAESLPQTVDLAQKQAQKLQVAP